MPHLGYNLLLLRNPDFMTDKVIVFSTCASREEGKRIARGLVEERLAACVNVIDGIVSIYQWQGKVHEGDEVMLW